MNASRLRLAVCEAPAELVPGDRGWQALVRRVRRIQPDVFLLNEMPFGRWIAAHPQRDLRVLTASQRVHAEGMERLGEFEVPVVIGSRAAMHDGKSANEGFVWEVGKGIRIAHTKQFFPDEPDYYEARWFEPAEPKFRVVDASGLKIGLLICTDVMFNEWARHYGLAGAHLIAVPRATERGTVARWKIAMQMAAVASGCYVASSNRAGRDSHGQVFGGRGWMVDPGGQVIGETAARRPVVAATLDLTWPPKAQQQYPRDVARRAEGKG